METEQLDSPGYQAALAQARLGAEEGGVPIGSSLFHGSIRIAHGRNRRVQKDDPMAHAEIDCLRTAGRRVDYSQLTLFSTLAPCALCSGAIIQFGIRKVIVGESRSFGGELEWLRSRGVQVAVLDEPQSRALMQDFIDRCPALWNEDIGLPPTGS